jgi:hypothetical protein
VGHLLVVVEELDLQREVGAVGPGLSTAFSVLLVLVLPVLLLALLLLLLLLVLPVLLPLLLLGPRRRPS